MDGDHFSACCAWVTPNWSPPALSLFSSFSSLFFNSYCAHQQGNGRIYFELYILACDLNPPMATRVDVHLSLSCPPPHTHTLKARKLKRHGFIRSWHRLVGERKSLSLAISGLMIWLQIKAYFPGSACQTAPVAVKEQLWNKQQLRLTVCLSGVWRCSLTRCWN